MKNRIRAKVFFGLGLAFMATMPVAQGMQKLKNLFKKSEFIYTDKDGFVYTEVYKVIHDKNLEEFKKLEELKKLVQNGADLTCVGKSDVSKHSALLEAINVRNFAIAHYLIEEKGVDVGAICKVDGSSQSALFHVLKRKMCLDQIGYFVCKHLSQGYNLEAVDKLDDGTTTGRSLFYAIQFVDDVVEDVDVIKCLIEYGAQANIAFFAPFMQGQTGYYDYAMSKKKLCIANYLKDLKAGALTEVCNPFVTFKQRLEDMREYWKKNTMSPENIQLCLIGTNICNKMQGMKELLWLSGQSREALEKPLETIKTTYINDKTKLNKGYETVSVYLFQKNLLTNFKQFQDISIEFNA